MESRWCLRGPEAPRLARGRYTAGQMCAGEHVTWAIRAREQVTHHYHRKSEGTTDAASMWEDCRGYVRGALSRLHHGYGGGDDLYGPRRGGELDGGPRSGGPRGRGRRGGAQNRGKNRGGGTRGPHT